MMTTFDAVMIVEGSQEADEEEFIDACQLLINTGLAWQLQGFFGRTCQDMINQGYCTK
jgi:hypothetical protein